MTIKSTDKIEEKMGTVNENVTYNALINLDFATVYSPPSYSTVLYSTTAFMWFLQQYLYHIYSSIILLLLFHKCYKEWFGLGKKSSEDAFQRTFNSLTRNCP